MLAFSGVLVEKSHTVIWVTRNALEACQLLPRESLDGPFFHRPLSLLAFTGIPSCPTGIPALKFHAFSSAIFSAPYVKILCTLRIKNSQLSLQTIQISYVI